MGRLNDDIEILFPKWWRFAHRHYKQQIVLAWNRLTYFKMIHRQTYLSTWRDQWLEDMTISTLFGVAPDIEVRILQSLHHLCNPLNHHWKMPDEILRVLENYKGEDLPYEKPSEHQHIQGLFKDPL